MIRLKPAWTLMTMCLLSTASTLRAASGDGETAAAAPSRSSTTTSLLSPLPPPPIDGDQPLKDPRDFEGTWLGGESLPTIARAPVSNESILTPEARQRRARRLEMSRRGTPVATPSQLCRAYPVVLDLDLVPGSFPFSVVQTRDKLVFLVEEGRGVWQIFLNRGHSRNLPPAYRGDSTGHWEGDTLVVDVAGFNGRQWIDSLSGPNSRDMRMTVRIKKIDDGRKLQIVTQVYDAANYQTPMVHSGVGVWHPELRLLEFNCEENMSAEGIPGYVIEK